MVDPKTAQQLHAGSALKSDDRNIYAWLLNGALRQSLIRRGVRFDRAHNRYYFLPDHETITRREQARTKTGRAQSAKKVVRQDGAGTDHPRDIWWHLAAQLRFEQFTANSWGLTIRPEFHLTKDGRDPLEPWRVGRMVTKRKSRMYNEGYFDAVHFFRYFLLDGKARFTLKVGRQAIVVDGDFPSVNAKWPQITDKRFDPVSMLGEPDLAFADELTHIDPKVGIPASGPWSRDQANHPASVTAGFIGTAECIDKARAWLSRAAEGVDGDDDHHPFCGFQLAGPFASQLRTNGPEAKVTASEIRDLSADKLKKLEGFNLLLGLIDDRLAQLASLDAPPAIVFIALPADIVKRYGTVHQTKQGVETVWNLRSAIKARAMQHGRRTQLLRQATIESDLESHTSDLDHPADLAWNLFTAMYFKAGGFPWAPVGIPEGTCHLGVTFFRPHGERSAMRTSVAQAFAENGDAFVLRGNPFEWEGKWPHLPAEEARRLIADVISRYTQTMKRPPRRLVVHKQSRFFAEELTGFQDALADYEYDLVALAPSTGVRLMRHGAYPPPRGACLSVGDRRYLYTTGYVPSLGRYPHGHVPTPVQITDHVGDSSARALLAEILLMTKMNWNSARFAEKLPVTVRFANEVGTILRDLPDDYVPEARYAFYM